jgi:predicted RNA binding protein YcfA (HicA-like mRNA interferase family)
LPRLRDISGRKCIYILTKHFGFNIARQKGSHIVLRKVDIGTVVPNHSSIRVGTLKSILKLARIDINEFIKYI